MGLLLQVTLVYLVTQAFQVIVVLGYQVTLVLVYLATLVIQVTLVCLAKVL